MLITTRFQYSIRYTMRSALALALALPVGRCVYFIHISNTISNTWLEWSCRVSCFIVQILRSADRKMNILMTVDDIRELMKIKGKKPSLVFSIGTGYGIVCNYAPECVDFCCFSFLLLSTTWNKIDWIANKFRLRTGFSFHQQNSFHFFYWFLILLSIVFLLHSICNWIQRVYFSCACDWFVTFWQICS